MKEAGLSLGLALLVGIVYYFSNQHIIKDENKGKKVISFSAGVSITYLLLELFPRFNEGALAINKLLFVSVLLGFITHHIVEKEIYKHNQKHELIKMLSLEEAIFSFVYHVVIGMILVNFLKESIIGGTLFFVPMAFYTFLTTLPMEPHSKRTKTFFLSGATLVGSVISVLLGKLFPLWVEFMLMGIVIGVLLFSVIRHHIPFGRKGKIGYFTLGFVAYSLLIIGSWYI